MIFSGTRFAQNMVRASWSSSGSIFPDIFDSINVWLTKTVELSRSLIVVLTNGSTMFFLCVMTSVECSLRPRCGASDVSTSYSNVFFLHYGVNIPTEF